MSKFITSIDCKNNSEITVCEESGDYELTIRTDEEEVKLQVSTSDLAYMIGKIVAYDTDISKDTLKEIADSL